METMNGLLLLIAYLPLVGLSVFLFIRYRNSQTVPERRLPKRNIPARNGRFPMPTACWKTPVRA